MGKTTRLQFLFKHIVLWGLVAFVTQGRAQTPSLTLSRGSGATDGSITLTISINSNGGTRPAAVQWDLNYSQADLVLANGTFFSAGAAAISADKSVSCKTPAAGTVRCIVSGLNRTSIGDGDLASVTFQLVSNGKSATSTISFAKTLGADRAGAPIMLSGSSISVIIAEPTP